MSVLALWVVSACFGFLSLQEPGADLVAQLDAPQPTDRIRAAEQIAAMGVDVEEWLEDEIGKGSAIRQRGVLLALASLGTPRALDLLADAARSGRRASTERAWALLLYASSHPDAGRDPKADWKRAATAFEQSCLLAGYLCHERAPEIAALQKAVGKKPTVRQQALMAMLAARAGERFPAVDGKSPAALRAARLLSSLAPGQQALTEEELIAVSAGLPGEWRAAAKRTPGRGLQGLRGTTLGGEEAANVFALLEVEEGERQAVFDFLVSRVTSMPGAAWLWGLAGEFALELPARQDEPVISAEVAGLLELGLVHFERAEAHARTRADQARLQIEAGKARGELESLAPVVLLAIAGRQEDSVWFQERLAQASPERRVRLQPLWLLASRRYADARAREALLARWALDYGAGTRGFLDRSGRTFMGLVLLGGTLAASDAPQLRAFHEAFDDEHDHPITNEFYADLAALLADDHFQWRFAKS